MNYLYGATLALLIASPLHAQTTADTPLTAPPTANSQDQFMDPRTMIQSGVDRIKGFIDSSVAIDPNTVDLFLEKEISPYFDFDAMTRLILGPLEYQLDTKQRYAVQIMIRNQFLKAFAENLMNYRGGQIDYLNVAGNVGMGRARVRMRIYRPGQYPIGIELRIARSQQGWKIYDVAANGISAVAYYRNYIQSLIMRSGPEALTQP